MSRTPGVGDLQSRKESHRSDRKPSVLEISVLDEEFDWILISTDHSGIIAQSFEAKINNQSYVLKINEEISSEMLFVSGAEFFSPKIQIKTEKLESIDLVKGVAMDSVSKVPCTPEEMNSANLEKEVFQSGGIHATAKEGGPKSAKIFSESCSLRQDKKDHTKVLNNPREERVPWEKANKGEKTGVRNCSGKQAF
ncbi:hypothetical protein Ancab_034911 [Ancistrocladus abbreviatus]